MFERPLIPTGLLAALLGALALGAAPALAKDGDVLVRGSCTGASSAKLKLSPENGRIEAEFEVDQNRNGVRWNVVLTRNGVRVASLGRVTAGRSGSFEARRVLSNRPGRDVVRAVARRDGERCSARATFGA